MDSPIEELEKLLLLNSVDDVRVVGICGMGGIGKTTLATALFNKISHQFPVRCLIDDLSKIYRHDGPISAQKQILCQTLGEEYLQICNLYNASNLIRSRLRHVKSLIVLDNVDQFEQLEKLAMSREWLGAWSRIVIISRNEHILKQYGVDVVYKVPFLNHTNSLRLFSQKAFKLDHIISGYDKLVIDILRYANGLPLAIKVLGSFLFDRGISEWESALARLRESPNKDIMDVLRLSFEGLEKLEKEIFLDIACFIHPYGEIYVKNILNCCGFHPDIGLRVLSDKSLISVNNKSIQMHSLLKELGKKIAQENTTKDLRKWSRLWLPGHFNNVMLENMEKNVEAIVFRHQSGGFAREIKTLVAETLSNMSHLRLLILEDVDLSGSLSYLSNELRYVEWDRYPFMYLPSSFQPNQLVELHLRNSSIKQLWEGEKFLPNLKTLDLMHSQNLIKMPNFGEVPNLELLNLEGCVNLVQIDPSIGLLRKLVFLTLNNCRNLISIPNNIFGLSSLNYLNLSGCCKVFNNPKHLKKLDSSENVLHSQSMSSVLKWITVPFRSFYPKAHKGLASCLLSSLASFSFLCELDISFCGLSQIPDALGCIRWLERLNLMGNNFVKLPSLGELSKLVYLNLQHCKQLKFLPELPSPAAIRQDQNDRRWGLEIFNCPELEEREHCGSMTFSWMIQFIQANQESPACFTRNDHIGIVIPGSKIPRWFDTQSVHNSVSIDLSPIVHDNSFIGLAYCVVFSVTFDDSIATNEHDWIPETWLHFECDNYRVGFARCPLILDRDLVTVESNHMWIIYIPRESLFDFLRYARNSWFDFQDLSNTSTTSRDLCRFTMDIDMQDEKGLHVEVKKCGHRCVFKQDLQQFNSTMMHHRKRKFVAIED